MTTRTALTSSLHCAFGLTTVSSYSSATNLASILITSEQYATLAGALNYVKRILVGSSVRSVPCLGFSRRPLTRIHAYAGEKGIGFKSVFTVADKVYITSGPYSFHFDKTMPLGMITPILGSEYRPVRGWTTFHLHLAQSVNGNDLSAQLRDVRPTLLLFLRQLRTLSITTPGVRQRNIEVRRTDDDDRDMITLERIQNGARDVERYVLVRHLAQTPAEEPGREDVKESEIVLAFPVTDTQEPVTKKQEVHAFLPLRCYGFKVRFPVWAQTCAETYYKSLSSRRILSPPPAGRMS